MSDRGSRRVTRTRQDRGVYPPDDRRFDGVTVPNPEFADDDGSAAPRVLEALDAHAMGRASVRDVAAALHGTRLMTPLVAVLDEDEETEAGLRVEKSSHMASVSVLTSDGRRGLLAFSSVASMAAWDPAARGIPAHAGRAAAAALEEGADALVIDLGGPSRAAIEGALLVALATGRDLPPAHDDPDVRAAAAQVLGTVDGLRAARLVPRNDGDGTDLRVLVAAAPGADLADVARRAARGLVDDPVVAALCPGGVDVGELAVD
jgi:hypothetical protein